MAYTPQQWHDDTTDSPYGPISGARLNYIEAGIEAAAAAADAAGTASGTASLSTTGTAAQTVVSAVTVTGTLTAPLVDKAGQVFNVKAYGALGDGATDDASAIQAAVDAAGAAGGGVVLFPTGVYKVNTGISVILPSVVFQGSGWDQSTVTVGSVLKAGTTMTSLVNISSVGSTFASQHMSYDGAGVATNCVTIDGLNAQFLQSHARHPATNGVGFNVTANATSAWFTDCRFNGANQSGCVGWAINGTDSMLHGCKGVNCLDAVTYGSTASGGQQTGCHHTPGSTIGRCAINVAGNAANLILVGNRIDSHKLGSGIQVTPSANIVGLQIVSNTFYPGTALTDNTFAAIGFDTTSAHIYQCVINDNIIRSSSSNRYASLLTAQTLAGSAATNPTRISGDGTTVNGNSVYAVAMYGTSSSPLMARGNVLSTDGTAYTAQSNIGALDSGSVSLGTAAPIINGTAAAGTSGSAAHEDHVHPTDTSRVATTQMWSRYARPMADTTAVGTAVTFTNAGTSTLSTASTTISPTSSSTGNITSGSATILSANGAYTVGDAVSASGIPQGARIGSVNGTTLTMVDWAGNALNATASTSGVTLVTPNPAAPWRYTRNEVDTFTLYSAIALPLQVWSSASSNRRVGAGTNEILRIEFDFDGQSFELKMDQFSAPHSIRVWANEAVSADSTVITATGAVGYTKIDFGSRAYRRVVLEVDLGAWFGGIRHLNTDSVMPPSMTATTKFALVGDSYGQGGGIVSGVPSSQGYAERLARLLGVVNFRNRCMSGTGFVTAGGQGTYRSRISDVTSTFWQPDVILVQGSINDSGVAGIQAEVTTYLTALRAALPSASIYVVGVMRPLAATGNDLTNNAAIKAACAAMSPAITFIDPQTGAEGAWFAGSGQVGATTGNGNADFYHSSVSVNHPSLAGHEYMARQIAAHLAPLMGVAL